MKCAGRNQFQFLPLILLGIEAYFNFVHGGFPITTNPGLKLTKVWSIYIAVQYTNPF